MSNFNKNGWVSLAQICEERQLVIDAETGKKVLRPAYFSSMNALIEGAFQFARFFEEIHQKGKVYCSISPDVFYFNLKNGAFHFEGEEFLGEAYVQEPDAAEIEFTEFLAPELAEALAEEQEALETFKEFYSLETDRYFMAVYLFEYFFHTGSPFEGKKMVNRCFLSPEEKELFRAREGRFCMEPGEEENIPVKGDTLSPPKLAPNASREGVDPGQGREPRRSAGTERHRNCRDAGPQARHKCR